MQLKTRMALFFLLLICAALPTEARSSRDDQNSGDNASLSRESDHDERGLDRAAGQARRETGGRVLSADEDGDRGYRVKVLTPDGRVRTLSIDGEDERRRDE